ncbi:hypothetical protein Slin15195_G074670 [Septoria linicola]|uniref:Rhodopsin domain-containing protein n=1 Tax=Septoria linicola TaxID=215465 RepID=A0A9Q9AY08_9PEZI|nr:hypothetical protein Slin15195_G074670 [Septoria linicola]
MGSTQVYHDPTYMKEVWGLFGVGVAVLLARFAVRLRTVGFRQFAGDDYISILVLACYAADAITVTITYFEGTNVDFSEDEVSRLTAAQIKSVEYGSRMQLLAWYTYVTLIWGLKGCMLFFFGRLTFGLTQERYVKALGVTCGITYLAMLLTITTSCHPIHLNWQVRPKPPEHCELRIQNFYVCTVLNVTTDAALLAVPLPLLWKLRVPLRKKITLGLLLSSGIFIITAAIVRIIMTLKSNPSATTINRWGVRETITMICAVNAPILKPLTMKSFYTRGFRLSGSHLRWCLQPDAEAEGSDSNGKSSDGTSKSKNGSSLSWPNRKVQETELMNFHESRAGSRIDTGMPPQGPIRPPTILTPIAAQLQDIERIDTRLDANQSQDDIVRQDRSFERGEYFGSMDIMERGRGPTPVPIEIIDAQPLYMSPAVGSLILPDQPDPARRRWSEQIRYGRLARQWRDLGRPVSMQWFRKASN